MRQKSSRIQNRSKSAGFTLLELIIVMALIAILSISFASITSQSVSGYIDATDRNRLSQDSKRSLERISRELREALPQSIRTGSSGGIACVEFRPVANASTDLDLAASGAISSFNAVAWDLTTTFSAGQQVAIMPIDAGDLYAGSGILANVASIAVSGANQVLVTLSSATSFSRRSPQRRFYLLNTAVSFCQNDANGELRRYSGYVAGAAQSYPPAGASDLFGQNFYANGTVFNYQPGSLQNASLLQMNFLLQNKNRLTTGNSESFEVFHEVHIRNVP